MPSPADLRNRPQDGISRVQKVAAVETGIRGAPGCFQGIRVYIGERSTSVELCGAHEGGARAYPPRRALLPRGVLHFNSKSSGLLSVQERSSRRFHSIWTLFGIPFLQNSKTRKKQKLALGSRLIG